MRTEHGGGGQGERPAGADVEGDGVWRGRSQERPPRLSNCLVGEGREGFVRQATLEHKQDSHPVDALALQQSQLGWAGDRGFLQLLGPPRAQTKLPSGKEAAT